MTEERNSDKTRGEGDRKAARRYNEAAHEFVESGKAADAPDPADQSEEIADRAERDGKDRAKEFDPEVHRDYDRPTKG